MVTLFRGALCACAVLALLDSRTPVASGQEGKKEPTETVIRLVVDARAAPRPALKHQLLPELGEQSSGNPVQGYLACFCEQQQLFFNKEVVEQRYKQLETPLKDLPKDLADYGGIGLDRFEQAARLEHADWQVLLNLRRDGIKLLLPEIQQMRSLASANQLRLRGRIKVGRFDDAMVSAKTNLALARHLGEHPTLIAGLVGFAIAGLTTDALEEMVQEPGSPNLFWAHANLPRPFLSLRPGVQSERVMLRDLSKQIERRRPMTEGELAKAYEDMRQLVRQLFQGDVKVDIDPGLIVQARAQDPKLVQVARLRLLEAGSSKADLERMPPGQILLLDGAVRVEHLRDESLKWLNQPFWISSPGLARADAAVRELKKENLPEYPLLSSLLAPLRSVALAQARIDMRLGALQHVEALRLYAAHHEGKLPVKLEDMGLPLPVDPFSGRPFDYRLDGKTAHLRPNVPESLRDHRGINIRLEILIR